MKCPKCNRGMTPICYDTKNKIRFRLQYKDKREVAFTCDNGCPGLWTETSAKKQKEMTNKPAVAW